MNLLATIIASLFIPFMLWAVTGRNMDPEARRIARRFAFVCGTVIALVIIAIFTLASIAVSYPENFRHGYPSCASCHVAGAAGGGMPTAYGRSAGAEIVPTWTFAEPPLPEWMSVGADSRYVVRPDDPWFPMQAELELGLSPVPALTFAGTVGGYGPTRDLQFRRLYGLVRVGDVATLRAGRFIPTFGIPFPDHRIPTRAGLGLGQGGESYNAEAAITAGFGELVLTEVAGDDTTLDLGRSYAMSTDSRNGFVGRLSVFLGDRARIGSSYLSLASADGPGTVAGGGFVMVAPIPSVYLLAEYDRRQDDAAQPVDLAVAHLGYEPLKGLHLVAIGDVNGDVRTPGAQVQWFPIPHVELLAEYRDRQPLLLLHFYL